jgi:uncharacterized protein YbgA (DUF1722 family)/uncharacterized protein YbbK (DUF523 family)
MHENMKAFPKPIIITSKCFEFDACRYNGQMIPNNLVQALGPFVQFQPVCPEVEIGLGVPRDPVRIISKKGVRNLVQPSTERDLTGLMNTFSDKYLGSLGEVDGFILKSRSPSCAIKDTELYTDAENEIATGKGPGLFAEKVLEKFPGAAVEDEGRLRNPAIREHYLTRIFTLARWRRTKKIGTMKALVDFQSDNKFLLMSYNQKEMKELGRIVGNKGRVTVQETLDLYDTHLRKALSKTPRRNSNINVLMHALDYFSEVLTAKEKRFFLGLLENYKNEKTTLGALQSVMESWIIKCDEPYLAGQTYFHPYPVELVEKGGLEVS